jgi:hypothetical protein
MGRLVSKTFRTNKAIRATEGSIDQRKKMIAAHLIVDGDDAAGRGVAGRGEARNSPETGWRGWPQRRRWRRGRNP